MLRIVSEGGGTRQFGKSGEEGDAPPGRGRCEFVQIHCALANPHMVSAAGNTDPKCPRVDHLPVSEVLTILTHFLGAFLPAAFICWPQQISECG